MASCLPASGLGLTSPQMQASHLALITLPPDCFSSHMFTSFVGRETQIPL